MLANSIKSVMSNSSGTSFPSTELQVGMGCYRTDEGKVYHLKGFESDGTTPIWVVTADLSKAITDKAYVDSAISSLSASVGLALTGVAYYDQLLGPAVMRTADVAAATNLDTITQAGIHNVLVTSSPSRTLRVTAPSKGSTRVIQEEFNVETVPGKRWRSKLDTGAFSAWRYPVVTDINGVVQSPLFFAGATAGAAALILNEVGAVGSGQQGNTYAPAIRFAWYQGVTRDLKMTFNGQLLWNNQQVITAADGAAMTTPVDKAASYTGVLSDVSGRWFRMGASTAQTFTVPTNAAAALPIGTVWNVRQTGTGQLTIVAPIGVTINTAETLILRKQHSTCSLVKVGTDTWDLVGDMVLA